MNPVLSQTNKMELPVPALPKVTKSQEVMKNTSYAELSGTKCVLTLVPTWILLYSFQTHSTSLEVLKQKSGGTLIDLEEMKLF